MIYRSWMVQWIGFKGDLFYWEVYRFNSGYPYVSYRIGPILIKRYLF